MLVLPLSKSASSTRGPPKSSSGGFGAPGRLQLDPRHPPGCAAQRLTPLREMRARATCLPWGLCALPAPPPATLAVTPLPPSLRWHAGVRCMVAVARHGWCDPQPRRRPKGRHLRLIPAARSSGGDLRRHSMPLLPDPDHLGVPLPQRRKEAREALLRRPNLPCSSAGC